MRGVFVALSVACLFSSHLLAITRYVSPSGGNISPYTSWANAANRIQDAVDVAVDDDVIVVTNGVYVSGGGYAPGYVLSNRVVITKRIIVRSVNGPAVTTIVGAPDPNTGDRGPNAVRCAYLTNDAVLTGFTLTNGYTKDSFGMPYMDGYGGGVVLDNGGMLTNCLVELCKAHFGAGGVYCNYGGTVVGCVIQNCVAGNGAGVYCNSGGVVRTAVILKNHATAGPSISTSGGGGIYCKEGGYIKGCAIYSNKAEAGEESKGGGVLINAGGEVEGSLIFDNYSETWGGGIYVYQGGMVRKSGILMNETRINGGGINVVNDGEVRNCLIAKNIAQQRGGGVTLAWGGILQSCTIVSNYAVLRGGGLMCLGGGSNFNSIIYFNTAASNYPNCYNSFSSPRYSHCCTTPAITGAFDLGGNITDDPLFINNSGDYHLKENSPCLDSGVNMPWMIGATDIDGNPRIVNGIVDIGVYELATAELLCTWPEYIGMTQSGLIEFVSENAAAYTISAAGPNQTQDVASGVCAIGWNLVTFYAGDLPGTQINDANHLFLELNGQTIDAGTIYVVEDLSTDKKTPTEDMDNDKISVAYKNKGDGIISTKGRTIYIQNGSEADKIMVKVKAAKQGDGVCRICGIFSDNGFSKIKIAGSLTRMKMDGTGGTLMLKGGDLGKKCSTRRFFTIFDGPTDKAKGKIIVKASKDKNTKTFIGGNVFANILCGTLATEPAQVATRGGVKMIAALGGDFGSDAAKRHLVASSAGKIMTKPKKENGGSIVDYAFYFTGEEKTGSGASVKTIMADNVIDAAGPNTLVVCGHQDAVDPLSVTNWVGQQVDYSFGKMVIKGMTLEGTYVIKEWLKGGKEKHVKTKAEDDATWIVGGVKE